MRGLQVGMLLAECLNHDAYDLCFSGQPPGGLLLLFRLLLAPVEHTLLDLLHPVAQAVRSSWAHQPALACSQVLLVLRKKPGRVLISSVQQQSNRTWPCP